MKIKLLSILFIGSAIVSNCQTLLIVVNNESKVYVDGDEKGKVKADDALKVKIKKGEHYIQAKGKWNGIDKTISKTINIDGDAQTMVNLNFGDEPTTTKDGSASTGPAAIEVAELGTKIPGTYEVNTWRNNNANKEYPDYPKYYYGFEKGDEIVINYTSNTNSTNELVVVSYADKVIKYSNKDFKELKDIHVKVDQKGVYGFIMATKHMGTANGNLIIKRIPESDATKNFNTGIIWKDVNDTTYTEEQERYLIKSDTVIVDLSSPTIEVHSRYNSSNSNREYFGFTLPKNTISWGYYIGVDQSGEQAFENAVNQLTKSALPIISKFPTAGPIGAFVLSGVNLVAKLQSGESVSYTLVQGDQNRNLFLMNQTGYQEYKSGDVINDLEKMQGRIDAPTYFCFRNNNKVTAIHVTLRITAITVYQQWETKPVRKICVVTKHKPFCIN